MPLPDDVLARAPEEGARRLALERLDELAQAAARLEDPRDAEALHDFRVALRRLRSTLRAWRTPLEGALRKRHRKGLKGMQEATGAGRDAEVALEWVRAQRAELRPAQRGGLDWLARRLEEQRGGLGGSVARALRETFEQLEGGLRPRLETMILEVRLDRQERGPTFGAEAGQRVRDHARALALRMGEAAGPQDAAGLHAARIAGKRLRYLVEPWRERADGAGGLVRELKDLQDVLGELNDAHVLGERLAEALEQAAVERARTLHDLARSQSADDPSRALRRNPRAGLLELTRRNQARLEGLYEQLAARWDQAGVQRLVVKADELAEELERAASEGAEIERKYLLKGMPELPDGAKAVEIQQGWLPGDKLRERLRRVVRDGETTYLRTVKLGAGLQRVEVEEQTDARLFAALWPLTEGCRIAKTRHKVPVDGFTWEIDRFHERDLVLAEVELKRPDQTPELPPWLAPHVVREVTGEAEYTNLSLAHSGPDALA